MRFKNIKLKNMRLENVKIRLKNKRAQKFFLKTDKIKYLQLHLPRFCISQVENIKKIKY